MIHRFVPSKDVGRILTYLSVLACYQAALIGQQNAAAADAHAPDSRLHLTHILGFEGMSNNTNGDLFIQDGYLRFHRDGGSSAQIPVSSIKELTLGEQDKQVGGVPMMLAKTAAPYGGGRVISLFSHKKYDTITLEYVDSQGALHGAIFQLTKGKGQVLRSELAASGAHITDMEGGNEEPSTQETSNESK